MPRLAGGPTSSDEFNIRLVKPFTGPATSTIEITGEINRASTIKITTTHGDTIHEKEGSMPKDDVEELRDLLDSIRGFPSSSEKDVYGLDKKLEVNFMSVQWSNGEGDAAAENVNEEITDETKQTFKDVVESIEAAARTFAK